MLIYRRTSILESPAQTLVNTVNCVGVMGKGLAHAFREREPDMFKAYKRICEQKALTPGKLWLWRGRGSWVLNFPTKVHWRNPSKLEWIEQGLEKFVQAYEAQGITEISFPRLGCGNGGLDWDDVRPVMEHYLSQVAIPVYVHDHTVDVGLPEHLEHIAATLRSESIDPGSFEGFVTSISKAVEVAAGRLQTLDAKGTFAARILEDRGLAIETEHSTLLFEEDDLRGVWLDLQHGLLTERKAGWAMRDAGVPLLSILSTLPMVRAVEIQRAGADRPEFALEPCPNGRGYEAANQTAQQHELAWH